VFGLQLEALEDPVPAVEAIVSHKFLVQTAASSLNVEKLMLQPPANAGQGTSS